MITTSEEEDDEEEEEEKGEGSSNAPPLSLEDDVTAMEILSTRIEGYITS